MSTCNLNPAEYVTGKLFKKAISKELCPINCVLVSGSMYVTLNLLSGPHTADA